MKKVLSFVLGLGLCMGASAGELTQYVNPMIGSGGHGHVFVGANVPFGLVQLGPTMPTRGWDWCSGYHISDNVVIGFGHTHLSGTGIGDLGDIALLPIVSDTQKETTIKHSNEKVVPGYYHVTTDDGVVVDLTATTHCGLHRYNFPAGRTPTMLLNLNQGIGWDKWTKSHFTQVSPTAVCGYRYSTGWAKDQRVYFYAEFSRPLTLVSQTADTLGVFRVDDKAADGQLLVRVGISPTSIQAAANNLRHEITSWNFDSYCKAADNAWEKELERIHIDTDNTDDRTVFYTALYHFMEAPSEYSDYGAAHKDYTTFSLWDTYRAAMPLFTLIQTDKAKDMAQTFIDIYEEQGRLPMWYFWGNETYCMVGNPGIPILADFVLKGLCDNNEEAWRAIKATAMADGRGLTQLKEYGYVPYDKEVESVAKGLEFALADAGAAKVAKLYGTPDDYNYLFNRSRSYTKYFDKKTLFMRGLSSTGQWHSPFNPFRSVHQKDDYTEGNAWQYTFLVPQDVHGLVSLFPSEKRFVSKLDSLFIVQGDLGEGASPDISGLIGQYAHGNEPSHHVIYMYNYVGQPYKAARLLRRVYREMYKNNIDGLSGNEDVGQMSAWYVISACGLYQVEPSGGKFIIGSPLFKKAALNVGGGKTFTVEADNNSDKNIYIQKAFLNGQPYTKSYIDYKDIMAGGTLRLVMGAKPSKWGTAKKDRP